MKKIILIAFAFIFVNFNLAGQSLEQDISYYKVLNKLWTISSSFDKVAFHLNNNTVELEQIRTTELETIEKLHKDAVAEFELLKAKKYGKASLETLSKMLLATEKSRVDLNMEQWMTDPMWQYGYSLVKMELSGLETRQESMRHLTKND